jgi:hypothetical protein
MELKEEMLAEQDHKNTKGTSGKTIEKACRKYYKTKIKLGESIVGRMSYGFKSMPKLDLDNGT